VANQKYLPVKLAAQRLVATTEKLGSLVVRGLAAVQGLEGQQLSLTTEAYAEKLFRQGMRYRHDGEYGMPSDLHKTYEYLLKAANLDHAEAQYQLEYLNCELGDSAQEWGRTKPGYWLESSARLGFGPAQYEFAVNHFDFEVSDELPEDEYEQMIESAFAWYEKRAQAGDAKRQFRFAEIHLAGNVDIASRATGAHWLIESAKQGYWPACRRLGNEYLHFGNKHLHSPKVSELATKKGIYWLSRAVDLGDEFSCRTLGELYLLGHAKGKSARGLPPRLIEPDKKAAIAWYERGIAMGSLSTACDLGILYLVGKHLDQDLQLAEKWLLHAAMEGYDSARITLGVEYASGLRLQQNAGAAIHWLELAAERFPARLRLAEIYLEGKIVPQNFAEAINWLTRAADVGSYRNQAMKIVAKKCFDGQFSAAEESVARAWLLQMAAKAHESVFDMEHAQYGSHALQLAELYERGLGVAQDTEKAVYWYKQSGLPLAQTRLRELGIDWKPPDAP